MSAIDYVVGRKYNSLLLFHDHSFWDTTDASAWEIYGDQVQMPNGYVRPNDISTVKLAARCDLEKGRWNGIRDDIPYTNNSFSSVAPGGYLHHRNPITITDEFASMACWFKIRSEDANEFYGDKRYHITLWSWENFNNQKMKIEIRARNTIDGKDCIKIWYGDKLIQRYVPEPIIDDTWYHFVHTVYLDKDMYFLNGIKFHEEYTGRNYQTTPIKFNNIKIGAHDDWSSGGLTIDEFVVMNDIYSEDDFFRPDKPIYWIRPESLNLEELNEEKGLYYQMGSMLKFNYVIYTPTGIGVDKLLFENTQGYPLAIFKDNTRIDSTRWKGNIKEIKLLNMNDIAGIKDHNWAMVTIARFIHNNDGIVNGASLYDHILHPIRITRISYYQPPFDAVEQMYNKIEWYKNNKIPRCNFQYIDKFKVQFKE